MTESPNPTPEPIQVPPQDPQVAQDAAPAPAKADHTRTILEVVGGVLAVVLIGVGTIFGFVVGRVSADDHGRDMARVSFEQGRGQHGMSGKGQGQGPGMMDGRPGQGPGMGVDPDGDNWTGGGRHMDGDDRMMGPGQGPGMGVDPDGDNWTGENRGMTPPAPQPAPSSSAPTG